ncbi:MAG: hypothetical protein OEU92_18040 [Alphaproteobacteria bacterium]|nr:hypothetical protein [Alphaproteobacteria bacterium]
MAIARFVAVKQHHLRKGQPSAALALRVAYRILGISTAAVPPMPAIELLVPFFIASANFACVRGPGMLYALAQTLASGRRAGRNAVIGIDFAGFGHIAAASGV